MATTRTRRRSAASRPDPGSAGVLPVRGGSGSVVHDCSGTHVDGTFIQQASDTWTNGVKGRGVRVKALAGCVDLGIPPSLQPPTMSSTAWLSIAAYPVAAASGYVIGQSLNADSTGWRLGSLGIDGGALGWQHATGGTKYPVIAPGPALGTWHHLAVTFAPNVNIQLFMDGSLAAGQAGVPPLTFSAVSLRLGCRADDANLFDGFIDEVRIYDRVLTAAEIAAFATP